MASAVLPLVVSECLSWTSYCVGQQTGLPPSVADWDLGLSTETKPCLVGYFITATEVRLERRVTLIVPLTSKEIETKNCGWNARGSGHGG